MLENCRFVWVRRNRVAFKWRLHARRITTVRVMDLELQECSAQPSEYTENKVRRRKGTVGMTGCMTDVDSIARYHAAISILMLLRF